MDWLSGLVQGILGTLIYELLLAAAIAGLVAWLRSKQSTWAAPTLYGLAAFTAVLVILVTLTGRPLLSKQPEEVTGENIETKLKTWAENLSLPFAKGAVPDSYFSLSLSTHSGTPIVIARMLKDKPAYLQFVSTISFAPEHQAIMATLTKDQADTVMQEINLELAKGRVASTIANMGIPQTGTNGAGQTVVVLQKGVAIAGLNEANFADRVDDMEFTVSLVRSATQLAIRRAVAGRMITKAAAAH
jgi:hypothetical protein